MSQQNNDPKGTPSDTPGMSEAANQPGADDAGSGAAPDVNDQGTASSKGPASEMMSEALSAAGDVEPEYVSRDVHLAAVEAETSDLRDQMLRAVAETQNMRKRMEREVIAARKFAVAAFVNDIVPLTDNFQRAIEAVPADAVEADPALKSLLDGVTLTERQFISVLEKHGVKQVSPKGEIFDPNFHQAIAQLPNLDVPNGTILEVAQSGFALGERIIRPAMVVVATGGAKPAKPAGSGGPPPLPETKVVDTAKADEMHEADYDEDDEDDDGGPAPLDFS